MTHPATEDFVERWSSEFGPRATAPRDVTDRAFADATFYVALCGTVPAMRTRPSPGNLTRWLTANENRVVRTTLGPHRFVRDGRRWCLVPVPEEVAALTG